MNVALSFRIILTVLCFELYIADYVANISMRIVVCTDSNLVYVYLNFNACQNVVLVL